MAFVNGAQMRAVTAEEPAVERMIHQLPTLAAKDVPLDESCPICLIPFATVLAEQAAHDERKELNYVTKLQGCGHVFCRLDLVEWIRGRHGTCPTCRHTFLDIKPISDSDYESEDEDYIPGDDEMDEDEDVELDFTDESESDFTLELDSSSQGTFTDAEDSFAVEEEVDGGSMRNWGLSDGESISDEDLSFATEVGNGAASDGEEEVFVEAQDMPGSFPTDGSK